LTRVAAIDLGTNSTRLLVADVLAGEIVELERASTITRLGERVDETGRLQPTAIRRIWTCLDGYAAIIRRYDVERTLVIATSSVRDAENGGTFLFELNRDFRFETRVLTGDEEAELMFRGVRSDRQLAGGTLLVDIGGGSTELVLGGPEEISFSTSLQAGSVRMTERHLHTDPPTSAELEACSTDVRRLLPPLSTPDAIGVAATVKTAVAIDLGLEKYDRERIHGQRIATAGVREVLQRLAALPLAERSRIPALEPARAPVIVGGLVILHEILDAYDLPAIEARDRDVLHGAALAAASGGAG
jgi:exopolyphosphatase/guanosine-5'-triphosphate,3'-diphosphate pyrophosphatase